MGPVRLDQSWQQNQGALGGFAFTSRPWVSKEWSSLRVQRAPSPQAGHQDGFGHECRMGPDGELMAVPGHCSDACLFCREMGRSCSITRMVHQVTPAHAGFTEREFIRHTSAGVDFG